MDEHKPMPAHEATSETHAMPTVETPAATPITLIEAITQALLCKSPTIPP